MFFFFFRRMSRRPKTFRGIWIYNCNFLLFTADWQEFGKIHWYAHAHRWLSAHTKWFQLQQIKVYWRQVIWSHIYLCGDTFLNLLFKYPPYFSVSLFSMNADIEFSLEPPLSPMTFTFCCRYFCVGVTLLNLHPYKKTTDQFFLILFSN